MSLMIWGAGTHSLLRRNYKLLIAILETKLSISLKLPNLGPAIQKLSIQRNLYMHIVIQDDILSALFVIRKKEKGI